MFFQVRNLKSSAVEDFAINLQDNQVLVKYTGSDKSYLYQNVDSGDLMDFFAGEFESVGKFINGLIKCEDYSYQVI